MKNRKKWIVAVFALLLCVLMPTTVLAADTSGQMTVTSRKANSYVVTIPATVELSRTTSVEIKATYDIEPNKTLNVRISDGVNTDGRIALKRSDNETATAQVKLGNTPVTTSTVLARFSGYSDTQTTGGTLTIIPPASAKAGDYSATITFSFQIGE